MCDVGWSRMEELDLLPLCKNGGKHLHVRVLAQVGQGGGLKVPHNVFTKEYVNIKCVTSVFKLFLSLSFDIFLFHVSSVLGEQDEGRDGDEAGEHLTRTKVKHGVGDLYLVSRYLACEHLHRLGRGVGKEREAAREDRILWWEMVNRELEELCRSSHPVDEERPVKEQFLALAGSTWSWRERLRRK